MDGPVTRRSNPNSPGGSGRGYGEASYSPMKSSRGLPPISSRSKPGTYKKMPTHLNEPQVQPSLPHKVAHRARGQGRALVRAIEFRKTHKPPNTEIEVPLQQVRQMFQGRMQSIVMQNRKQVLRTSVQRGLCRLWFCADRCGSCSVRGT